MFDSEELRLKCHVFCLSCLKLKNLFSIIFFFVVVQTGLESMLELTECHLVWVVSRSVLSLVYVFWPFCTHVNSVQGLSKGASRKSFQDGDAQKQFSVFMSGWGEMEMDDTKLGLMSVCMYLSVYTEEEDVMFIFRKTEADIDSTIMERETKERLLLCSVLFWVVLGSFEFSLMQILDLVSLSYGWFQM